MAENDIPLDEKAIERAIVYPHFKWEETLMGKVSYPAPADGLMHNYFPKEKKSKKGKKGGVSKGGKSPKKKKER